MSKNIRRKIMAGLMIAALCITSAASAFAGTDPAGRSVVTGYSINGSRITKGDTTDIRVHIKHTSMTKSGRTESDIDVSRVADSFGGGTIKSKTITSADDSSPLEFDVTVTGIKYKGKGTTFRLMVGYRGVSGYENLDIDIAECREYEEPAPVPPEPPKDPDPVSAPRLIISRSTISAPMKPGEEEKIRIFVKNAGSIAVRKPVISFSASDELSIKGGNVMAELPDISPGKTVSTDIVVRTSKKMTAPKQFIEAEVKFDYFNRVTTAEGTGSGKVSIPADIPEEKKQEEEKEKTASAVPNIIIERFNYGGESVAAGKKFNLSFVFRNTSAKTPVENVVATVEGGEGFVINGAANTFYFQSVGRKGKKSISLPMKAMASLENGAQTVAVNFKYEYIDDGKRMPVTADLKISVPVYQPDRFEITKPEIPPVVFAGEETAITMNYVNKSKGQIMNVEAVIEGDVETPVRVQNPGNIEAGKSGTISFAVTAFEAGETSFDIKVSYEDGNGDMKERIFPVTLKVEEMAMEEPPADEEPVVPEEKSKLPFVIGGAVLAAVIVFFILRAKKKKAKKAEAQRLWSEDFEDEIENADSREEK